MQEQIHIETLIKEVEELYERLLDDRYALGEGRYAQMVTKDHILGGAQLSPYTQTDPRLPRRRSSTVTTRRTNVYVSFGAQQPPGATTNSAGTNPLTRVGSPLPYAKPRKRQRAISVKGGAYRTSARTPDHFTVVDATLIANPYTNNNNNNAMQDFMNPHAVPAAANPAIAQRGTCTALTSHISWLHASPLRPQQHHHQINLQL